MPIIELLEEKIQGLPKPKLIQVNSAFFMEMLVDNGAGADLTRQLMTINELKYGDIPVIHQFTNEILARFSLTEDFVNSLKNDIEPHNFTSYCFLIYGDNNYKLIDL